MIKRKLLSLGLATMLALSTSVVAFAEDTVVENPTDGVYTSGEITVGGSTKVPTIKVTVPSEGAFVINPYNMKVTVSDSEITDSIVSAEYTITNESDVAIAVNVTASAETQGVTLATAPLKGTETTKSAFVYLEVKEKSGSYAGAYDAKSANQVALSTKATTKSKVVTLAAGDETATEANYKFLGSAAVNPAQAWTAADTVTAKVVFTFSPQANATE